MLISKRHFLASVLAACLAALCVAQADEAFRLGPHYWPTPNPKFLQTGSMEGVLQPTVSGELSSGLFGCVRNDGHRFHEGLDLRPIARDKRNESIDPIYAFDDGVVRYVNRVAGNSGYGRYMVIEHAQIAPGLVTLYAHLRSVPESIHAGVSVKGGQKIAVMGRSAGGYSIPRSRAHLHFEVGFWLGPNFQAWYDKQPFGSENEHGAYNGMNIVGLDGWELCGALRRGQAEDVWQFIMSEQIAVEAYVRDTAIPDLLEVNPHLMANVRLPDDHAGWLIELTWYGLPTRFRALTSLEMEGKDRWLTARALRPDLLEGKYCMDLARDDLFGGAGARLTSLINRMFVR
ncbi:M23 family metallopeptidase [Pelagicoccus sp. SDUM812003]|uniref:M23 family metallopeptidase n=1 Tax=Pelagicoccus sp. SDUM812003 TaxID=3041267 RepID=UPI00280F011B|nr:M23 family metallopeptidase [Pelagicoccus sp. SDUM812003]MDQ8205435.1 M23 family metallopeptidase [Pelagicoccus sp. SDUM812003]